MFQAPEILLFFSAAIHHLSRKEIAAAGRGDFRWQVKGVKDEAETHRLGGGSVGDVVFPGG